MKIIFLDFDGVINPFMHFSDTGEFSKIACGYVQTILTKLPDVRIVVSSSWRTHGLKAVQDILKKNGIDSTKVIGLTEGPKERPHEKVAREHHIEHWLRTHPEIDNFVILDDEAEIPDLIEKYVKTNPYVGFTQKDMEEAIKILTDTSKLH